MSNWRLTKRPLGSRSSFSTGTLQTLHIARQKVTPHEVEQLFANTTLDPSVELINGEQRYASIGHTNALKVLVMVWTMRAGMIRPVTAFPASRELVRRYWGKRGF